MAFGQRETRLGSARASLLTMICPSEDGSAFGNTFATAAVHRAPPCNPRNPNLKCWETEGGSRVGLTTSAILGTEDRLGPGGRVAKQHVSTSALAITDARVGRILYHAVRHHALPLPSLPTVRRQAPYWARLSALLRRRLPLRAADGFYASRLRTGKPLER